MYFCRVEGFSALFAEHGSRLERDAALRTERRPARCSKALFGFRRTLGCDCNVRVYVAIFAGLGTKVGTVETRTALLAEHASWLVRRTAEGAIDLWGFGLNVGRVKDGRKLMAAVRAEVGIVVDLGAAVFAEHGVSSRLGYIQDLNPMLGAVCCTTVSVSLAVWTRAVGQRNDV